MKLNAATIWLLAIALIATAGVVVLETQRPPEAESESTAEPIFDVEESEIQAFTLKTQLYDLAFERNEAGQWQMLSPEATPANDASVAYLLNLLAAGESDRSLSIPASEWEAFGFHQPLAVIEFTLTGEDQPRSLTLGGYDFNRSALYAQRDLPADAPNGLDTMTVLLLPPGFEDAVSRPLEDWKQVKSGEEAADGDTPEPSDGELDSEEETPEDPETPEENSPSDAPDADADALPAE